jgi:predicted lipoprotein with Yx(FWY)xxD motif
MPMRTVLALLTIAASAVIATAVAGAALGRSHSGASAHKVLVSTRSVTGLGKILVDRRGRTLYMFVPDKRRTVTCVRGCAAIWPPLKVPSKAKVVGTHGAKTKLLGIDRDPAGGRVATYHGWPLYTYVGDNHPGVAYGQALNLNGGLWYVLAPSGAVIKKKRHSSGTTTTTTTTTTPTQCSDDDGDGDQSAGAPDDGDGCV